MRIFIEGLLFWSALIFLVGEPTDFETGTWFWTKLIAILIIVGLIVTKAYVTKTKKNKKRSKMKHYVHNHNSDYGC